MFKGQAVGLSLPRPKLEPDLQQHLGFCTWLTHHSLHLSTPQTGLAVPPPYPHPSPLSSQATILHRNTASLALLSLWCQLIAAVSRAGNCGVSFFPKLMLPFRLGITVAWDSIPRLPLVSVPFVSFLRPCPGRGLHHRLPFTVQHSPPPAAFLSHLPKAGPALLLP